DSSFPRSMRTKRMERWVLGGLMSMPRTEKSPICDNRRVPKLPDTPVTKTTGFPLSIPGSILGSRRFGLAWFFAGFGFRGRVHLRRRGSPSSGTRSRGNSGAEIGFVQSRLGRLLDAFHGVLHSLLRQSYANLIVGLLQGLIILRHHLVNVVAVRFR